MLIQKDTEITKVCIRPQALESILKVHGLSDKRSDSLFVLEDEHADLLLKHFTEREPDYHRDRLIGIGDLIQITVSVLVVSEDGFYVMDQDECDETTGELISYIPERYITEIDPDLRTFRDYVDYHADRIILDMSPILRRKAHSILASPSPQILALKTIGFKGGIVNKLILNYKRATGNLEVVKVLQLREIDPYNWDMTKIPYSSIRLYRSGTTRRVFNEFSKPVMIHHRGIAEQLPL